MPKPGTKKRKKSTDGESAASIAKKKKSLSLAASANLMASFLKKATNKGKENSGEKSASAKLMASFLKTGKENDIKSSHVDSKLVSESTDNTTKTP